MAHIPHTATRQNALPAVYRPTYVEPADTDTDICTLEEELLARLDAWMARHPVASTVLAGASAAAMILIAAVALVASCI